MWNTLTPSKSGYYETHVRKPVNCYPTTNMDLWRVAPHMQLLAFLEAWTRILDSGNAVDAIYLDFRKAFDTIPHKRILAKLEGYGVTSKCLAWINAFLVARKQRIIINGHESSWEDVTSGIYHRVRS